MLGEESDLFRGPAALGADGQGVRMLRGMGHGAFGDPVGESLGQGEGLLGFAEEDAGCGGLCGQGQF